MNWHRATLVPALGILAVAGCGGSGGSHTSTLPPVQTEPTPEAAPPPSARKHFRLTIEYPDANARILTKHVLIGGRATPGLRVAVAEEKGRIVTTRADASGFWRARIRLYPPNVNVIGVTRPQYANASYIPEGEPQPYIEIKTRRAPPTPAQIDERRGRYLGHLDGKTQKQVENLIGPPDHDQEVQGQTYWYYEYADNTWQVIFGNGVVVEENKY